MGCGSRVVGREEWKVGGGKGDGEGGLECLIFEWVFNGLGGIMG